MKINSTIQRVAETIKKYNMIEKDDKVLVAVSGGADSVCLLHILYVLSENMGFKVGVAHLNHKIRGEEADADERFVETLARKLNIEYFVKRVEVETLARNKNVTVEEAGRIARYMFFDEIRQEKKYNKIATAHNRNDMAETILMRILRGTGSEGFAGIKYAREDGVVRPLLDVKRNEIEEYLDAIGLSYCTDKTNSDNNYTRNRVRNELIPMLEKDFNPNIIDTIAGMGETVSSDGEFVRKYAERLYERINNPLPKEEPVVLHKETMEMLEYPIKARLVRIASEKAMGKGFTLEKKHTDEILKLLDKETGAEIHLPKGLIVSVKYGWLEFRDEKNRKEVKEFFANEYSCEAEKDSRYYIEPLDLEIEITEEDYENYTPKKGEILIDKEKINEKLYIRNRRRGDKMAVFADGREKKVKSIFIDMKIDREERERIPLIATHGEVVAICGLRVSEKYKADKNTKRVWVIKIGDTGKNTGID